MKKLISSLLVVCCALSACKQDNLNTTEYVHYLENQDNGMKKEIKTNGWTYDIQYKPYDYILSMEHVSKEQRAERLRQLKGTIWFNISFKNDQCENNSALKCGAGSIDEYNTRLNYFLNEAAAEIKAVYNNEVELNQLGYMFENNYGLTPHETMVVGFSLPDGDALPEKDFAITYHDRLFKNGIIKATFEADKIKKLPSLLTTN